MLNNELRALFLNENSKVDYAKIKAYAKPSTMPQPEFKNYDEFRALFKNVKGKFGVINTP